MPERGHLIVVSAPSGAGKSTLVHRVLENMRTLRHSVSFTTRPARAAERQGVDYYFISPDEFNAKRDKGEFLEWAEVHNHMYATSRSFIESTLGKGEDCIIDVDVQGASSIRARVPEAKTVFVLPPSKAALEARLRARNVNSQADLERRLENSNEEVRRYSEFDYVIINDELGRAASALEAIITAARHEPPQLTDEIGPILATFGGKTGNA